MTTLDRFRLDGRVALITGGGGLLGLQHAIAIGSAGGTPVLMDVSEDALARGVSELAEKHRIQAHAVRADITARDEVQVAVANVARDFGRLDILINNAALTVKGGSSSSAREYFAPFEEYPLHFWQKALDVNLTGMFLVTQAVGKQMRARGSGVVLNIASDVGVISPDHRIYEGVVNPHTHEPFNTPIGYATTKAGVIHFTKYLATYWAKAGIRVNSLSPAGVYNGHGEDFVSQLTRLIPLGRMARIDEYQGAVLFLVSDASSFVTGANLMADGGRTAW